MDGALGLLGGTSGCGGGGGGGGVPSDGSTTAGSILTMAKEDHVGMLAEVSSASPVDDGLELGLGLGIGVGGGCGGGGGGDGGGLRSHTAIPFWGEYARILTAKDFPNLISNPNCCSSVKNPNSSTSGSKRAAIDSVSSPSVVGWPPIRRSHQMLPLANQTKPPDEQSSSMVQETPTNGTHHGSRETKRVGTKGYLPVKVNMDGTFIGRKVDLNAHGSYETLAQTLEDMFCRKRLRSESTEPSTLLDGSSEFVLTYEDKDGDCMLVGDVPWQMFISSVKRLRIMKNSESDKLEKYKHTARKERPA